MTENFHPREDEARFQILRSEGGKVWWPRAAIAKIYYHQNNL